ncbi:MAG TPA: hypothetical protein VK308_06375 [Pyrinomonadaceae bacterium]|nr:hypothetical protein [Pyrinomonadaceae bacterium]
MDEIEELQRQANALLAEGGKNARSGRSAERMRRDAGSRFSSRKTWNARAISPRDSAK